MAACVRMEEEARIVSLLETNQPRSIGRNLGKDLEGKEGSGKHRGVVLGKRKDLL